MFGIGESIYERGERGDELYLVVEGSVMLRSQPSSVDLHEQQPQVAVTGDSGYNVVKNAGKGERIAGNGDVFGEASLFPEELGPHRRESATTLSRMMAYTLNGAALQEIGDEYPEVSSASAI